MALSYVQYPGNGSTKAFDLTFGYLSRAHVFVFVDDALEAFTWTSPTRIELLTAPETGQTVTVRRLTDRVNRITTFADGQTLLAGDLNAGDLQVFYISQEMLDQVSDGVLTGAVSVNNPGTGYVTEQWIQDQLTANIGASEALNSLQSQITTEAATRAAAVASEAATRASAIASATASEASTRAAAIAAETAARVAALAAETSARTAAITALQATTADLQADLAAEVVNRVNDVAAAETYAAALVDDLLAQISDGLGTSDLEAAIISETSARTTADTALGSRIDAVISTANTDRSNASAAVASEASTRASADSALSTRVSAVEATVDTPTTGLSARVSTVETTATNLATNKADASVVTSLTTTVNSIPSGVSVLRDPSFRYGSTYWLVSQSGGIVTGITSTEQTRARGTRVKSVSGTASASSTTAYVFLRTQAAYGMPVKTGDIIGARCIVGGTNLREVRTRITTRGADGSTTVQNAATSVTTGIPDGSGETDTFIDVGRTLTMTAGSVSALIEISGFPAGPGPVTMWVAQPAMGRIASTSHAPPRFNDTWDVDTVRLQTAESSITTLQTSVVDLTANKAESSVVTALTSRVTTAEAALTTAQADLISEASTRASADSAAVSRLNALEASVNTAGTGLTARVTSAESTITDLNTNKASASSVTALTSRVTTTEGNITSLQSADTALTGRVTTAEADIVTEAATRSSADSAAASRLNSLESTVNTPTTGLSARITSAETTIADLNTNKASASSVTALTSRVSTAEGSITALTAADAAFGSRMTTAESGIATLNTTTADLNTNKASASSVTALTSRVTTAEGSLTSLTGRVTTAEAGITSEASTRASADSAAVSRLNALESTVNTAGTGLSARLATAETTITDLNTNKASASSVTALTSRVTTAEGGLTTLTGRVTTAEAGLTSEASTRASADSAAVTRLNALEASVNTPTTGLTARVTSAETTITDLNTNKASASSVTALTSRVTTAEGSLTALTGRTTTAEAAIVTEASTRASADSAAVTRLNALESTVNTPTTGLSARITSAETTITDLNTNKASASSVTSLTSRVTTAEGTLADKADTSALTTLTGRVTTAEGNITTLQSTTSGLTTGKADASTVTTLSARVSNAVGGMGQVTDFAADGLHWATNFGGSPGTIADASGVTYANVAGVGRVMQITTYPFYLTPKAAFKPVPGRRYRLTVRARAGVDATGGNLTVAINNVNGLSELWAHGTPNTTAYANGALPASANVTVAGGFTTISREWAVSGAGLGTYDAAWRLRIDVTRSAGSGGTVEIADFVVEDVTDIVAANANITSLQTTTANLNTGKADATVVTALTSRVAGVEASGRVSNPLFQGGITSGLPEGWLQWANTSGGTLVTRPDNTAAKAYRLSGAANANGGIYRQTPVGSIPANARYRAVAEASLVAGTYNGSGIYIIFRSSAGTQLSTLLIGFANTADTAGVTSNSQTGVRTWDVEFVTPASTSYVEFNVLTHWSGLSGGYAVANTIDWLQANLIPVSPRLATAESNISTLQTTTANLGTGKADATVVTALTSRVAANETSGRVPNASFQGTIASGIPESWGDWSLGAGGTLVTRPDNTNAKAYRLPAAAAANVGIRRVIPSGAIQPLARYRVVLESALVSGTYDGAGVYLEWRNAADTTLSAVLLSLANTADIAGVTSNSATGVRAWEQEYAAPANAVRAVFYLMTHWSSHNGGIAVANSIDWMYADLIPVSPRLANAESNITTLQTTSADLVANKASAASVTALTATVSGQTAGITELRNALATESTTEARLLLKVNTTTNEASFEVVSFSGDGTWGGSEITLKATLLKFLAKQINFGANTVFEDTYNTFHTTTGSKRNRYGGPFGTSGDLLEWFGPTTVALNSETKTNGYFAKATDGKVYSGGVDLAAVQTAATPLTATSNGNSVDTHTAAGSRTVTPSLTLSGATAPVSYFWSVLDVANGARPTITNPATATPSVTISYSAIATVEGVLQCLVRDAAGKEATALWGYYDEGTGGGGGSGGLPP